MTLHVAFFPFDVFAVIVAIPDRFPSTTPLLLTDATLGFALLQVTFLLVALLGETVAFKVYLLPRFTVTLVLFRDTFVTAIVYPPPTFAKFGMP